MPDGNLIPVTIRVQTPGDRPTLDARMARNDARGLPEAVPHKSCCIIGSGPSARHEALWDFIKANPEIPTVACNGALSLFIERNMAPTYWTCCDPQEAEVLNFLAEPLPRETIYLLATKCPESLFERLRSHDVRTWRLDDMAKSFEKVHITCAVSITLVTMSLMRFMGYHKFEMFGWDCCYLDGQHHASAQPEPEQPIPFVIEDWSNEMIVGRYYGTVKDIVFDVCGSWVAELHDACVQAHNYQAMGYEIAVHGPGAVATLLRAKKLIA